MSSFENRLKLTEVIEDKVKDIFSNDVVCEFGCASLLENEAFSEFLKSPGINQMHTGIMIKFAPDFILLKKSSPQAAFFIDIKHSISPIWSYYHYKLLSERSLDINNKHIKISDIGVIAREALLSYRRYYPNTIIVVASPYNKKLLMAQFANKIKCIYCYSNKNPSGFDCEECPLKVGGFFDVERASKSTGSQTPMTNIDLSSFEPIDHFFANLGITINMNAVKRIREYIKAEPLEMSSAPSDKIANHIRWELNASGCDWIDYTLYTRNNNSFIHIDRNCKGLNKGTGNIIESFSYDRNIVTRRLCKFCCNSYEENEVSRP